MPLGKSELCQLLPHTGDMCLLDTVQHWDVERIVCLANSHRDPANPLRRGAVLPAVSGVEYAAQAIGVHGRLTSPLTAKPAAGFLVNLREVELYVERLDDVAQALTIEAQRLAGTAQSVMCKFSLSAEGRHLLSGRALLLLEAA